MQDAFAIVEEPVSIPPGVQNLDLAAEVEKLYVRCGRLETRLQDERRAARAAQRDLLLALLDVADALDRMTLRAPGPADGPFAERQHHNIVVARRMVEQRLTRAGVVRMRLAGMTPDPSVADVEGEQEHPDLPDETVVEEISVGYRWENEVLRRAKVVVSRRP